MPNSSMKGRIIVLDSSDRGQPADLFAHQTALELRHALGEDQIIPHFQRLVNLKTGTLMGFEILARWPHPVRGFIPPDEFIPIADSYGLINELTEKLLVKAIEAASNWPGHLLLCVNISPHQLQDRSLVSMLSSIAVRKGFPLSRMVVEVTEGAYVKNMAIARESADELRDKGASLSLDDFGAGYAGLYHLQSLPFDYIKIDAGFVREMATHKKSRTLVAAVVALGHSLGLTIIAEGIENKTQADMLARFGCDVGQGWLFGRPIPAEEVSRSFDSSSLSQELEIPVAEIASESASRSEALPDHRLPELQGICHKAPVRLSYLERDLRIVGLNKRLTEMFDHPLIPYLGRRMEEAGRDLAEQLKSLFLRALNGEPVDDFVLRWKDSVGSKDQVFMVSTEVARGEVNEVVGLSVSAVNVSAQKCMEESPHKGGNSSLPLDALTSPETEASDSETSVVDCGPS